MVSFLVLIPRPLFEELKKIGVNWRDIKLIINLYMQQTSVVRTENADSEPGEIGRRVRQGCLLSPLLFPIYAEIMIPSQVCHFS